MNKFLSVGCGAYDRTWPLIANRIPIVGYDLDWKILPAEEVFLRGMLGGEFAIAEMSMSSYLLQCSRGEHLYEAIPVFVSRKFRHGAIYIRADAGITKPEDLRGRRIGLPEYQLTANVWIRGLLSDEYSVRAEDIDWVIGGIDAPGRDEKIPVTLPDTFRTTKLKPGETLWLLMQRGEIDAIIAPRAPQAFIDGDPGIQRLFRDVIVEEQAYYKKTALFPLMHVIGLRKDLVTQSPDLRKIVFDAFEAGRRYAVHEMHQSNFDAVMLPWMSEQLREAEAVMGADYWPYGLEPNRHAIDTLCRYSHEQGITNSRMTIEQLFYIPD
ncbi:ABC transporter substrate-binding protein [Neorhizobium sp. T786]|uniref:ABC transporter substrate-binding protein n=1 Tax=Pseudorhizobium xiangyangii TaxID=2883104 RepID=UPI001CFFC2E1|nr:ABC transporter substrate-binding protein [Neorhizobium xiangyangii]MCB5204596.1 ABC transporter substrate-binding protein [Neorhizobium xiangyangii]